MRALSAKNLSIGVAALAIVGAGTFWLLTIPSTLGSEEIASNESHEVDLANGENLFWAGGCASCHAAPEAKGDDKKILSGGHVLKTEFGDFAVPNISPDKENGIGNWSFADFANAVKKGVSPEGRHYYPAFPYASYTHASMSDVADLFGFMKTLPSSSEASQPSDLKFPFNISRGLGLWKILYLNEAPIVSDETIGIDAKLLRGRYLVEGIGHCGECHTPRTLAGGMDRSRWLEGGPSPDRPGKIPDITNSADGLGDWGASDIAYALETGFTPDFDSLGSSMADVVENYGKVEPSDREAIAAYLKSLGGNE